MTMNGIDTESEPEGMDEQNDLSWSEYPIDTLLIRNERRSVFEVVRRIKRVNISWTRTSSETSYGL